MPLVLVMASLVKHKNLNCSDAVPGAAISFGNRLRTEEASDEIDRQD